VRSDTICIEELALKHDKGIFCISLDFELYWGMRDAVTLSQYHAHLKGVPQAIEALLESFRVNHIHATWAVVGFLFLKDENDFQTHTPTHLPNYTHKNISPYLYVNNKQKLQHHLHFAPDLIEKILLSPHQEIATHTYSHLYTLEQGILKQDFLEDLKMALYIAKERFNLEIVSLVFPRNQWSTHFLPILSELHILSYRGNANSWICRRKQSKKDSKFKKLLRLIDSYINLTGYHTYSLKHLLQHRPYNIPSSRFLRPYSKKLEFLDGIKLERIKKSMTYAAQHNELFHLWWHPHNFGENLQKNIQFLEEIFSHYHTLEKRYGMKSYNMREISDILQQYEL
jgi:hypothetical protein